MLLPDKTVVRIVVGGLAAALLLCIVGTIVMIETGKDPKDILPLATGALGALAGVLARTSSEQSGDPIQVTPVAAPQPVPLPVPDPAPVTDPTGGGDAPPVDGGGDLSGGVSTRRPRATTTPRTTRGRR
jgi:hypothetical protein